MCHIKWFAVEVCTALFYLNSNTPEWPQRNSWPAACEENPSIPPVSTESGTNPFCFCIKLDQSKYHIIHIKLDQSFQFQHKFGPIPPLQHRVWPITSAPAETVTNPARFNRHSSSILSSPAKSFNNPAHFCNYLVHNPMFSRKIWISPLTSSESWMNLAHFQDWSTPISPACTENVNSSITTTVIVYIYVA